jgi:hypothetical protein
VGGWGGGRRTTTDTDLASGSSKVSRFSQRVAMIDSYLFGYFRKMSLITTMASCNNILVVNNDLELGYPSSYSHNTYFFDNLQMCLISWSICPWQDYTA